MCRLIFILMVSFTGLGISLAQQNPKDRIYQAFISDQMDDWDQVIVELYSRKSSLSDAQLAELVNFYYGYSGWLMEDGPKKKSKQYIEEADEIIDYLLAKYPDESDWYAYKAAFYAYKLGLNPIKAPFLGGKSMENIDLAILNGPESPQGWIEKGNALFYMPKAFGGDKEKAIEAFYKAIVFMEKQPATLFHNWIYLSTLMKLGQAYEKTEDFKMAKITYDKLLLIEPNFSYVRDELYPAFIKSYNTQD